MIGSMPVYLTTRKSANPRALLEVLEREYPGTRWADPPPITDDLKLPDAAAYCGWSVSTLNRARRAWKAAFPKDRIELRTPRTERQLLEHCTVSIRPFQLDRLKEWWSIRPLPSAPLTSVRSGAVAICVSDPLRTFADRDRPSGQA